MLSNIIRKLSVKFIIKRLKKRDLVSSTSLSGHKFYADGSAYRWTDGDICIHSEADAHRKTFIIEMINHRLMKTTETQQLRESRKEIPQQRKRNATETCNETI